MASKKKAKDTKGPNLVKAPATAAGQLLGYGLQYTRLVAMLLAAPERSVCSLEVLDDAETTNPDGTVSLVQTKSALTSNPVADRAISLWKTLYNWIALVKGGYIEVERTRFELYVSRPVAGNIVESFSKVTTNEDALTALADARDELWGVAPEFLLRDQLAENVARYANAVLQEDSNLTASIIMRLELVCGSGSPQRDIEATIGRLLISPSRIFDLADKLCGWVKRNVDIQLEKQLPAYIDRDKFYHEALAFVRLIDRALILSSRVPHPSAEEQSRRRQDTFVRQIGIIDLDENHQLNAICDFMLASADRVIWADAGEVHADSFDQIDQALRRVWVNTKGSVQAAHAAKDEIVKGQLIYFDCMRHRADVQGMVPPDHFLPGCYHQLANTQAIGWHPNFQDLLKHGNTPTDL